MCRYDKKFVEGGWSDQVHSSQSEREIGGGCGGAACSFPGSWYEPVRLIPDAPTRKSFPCSSLHRCSEHWPEALLTIADIRFESRELSDVESDTQLLVLLPDQKVIMAFDAVFSTKDHAFTLAGHFDHWLAVLDELKKIAGYDLIITGHNVSTDRSALEATAAYVRKAKDIHAQSNPGWADFSGMFLSMAKPETNQELQNR